VTEVGTELPEQTYPVTRADLVRYAGASGDFNPIHWNQRIATSVGLPDVIAHGMLTMALAGRAVLDDGRLRVDLTVTSNGEKVLSLARAVVRLP
jgi:acyl dehydratase